MCIDLYQCLIFLRYDPVRLTGRQNPSTKLRLPVLLPETIWYSLFATITISTKQQQQQKHVKVMNTGTLKALVFFSHSQLVTSMRLPWVLWTAAPLMAWLTAWPNWRRGPICVVHFSAPDLVRRIHMYLYILVPILCPQSLYVSSTYLPLCVPRRFLYVSPVEKKKKFGWGCSSVGRILDRHAADAGSIPRCGKGFFS